MLNNRIKGVFLPVIMLLLFFMATSFAQVQDTRPQENDMNRQNAERWTQTLNNRLNLTEDQQTRINSILMDYQTRRSQFGATTDQTTLQNDINRQIEGVLDDNQRTNWDAYSLTWWNEINRGTGTEFDNRNNLELDRDTDLNQDTDTDVDRNTDTNTDVDRNTDTDTETNTDDDQR